MEASDTQDEDVSWPPASVSVPTDHTAYGFGSNAGRVLMRLGECLLGGIHKLLTRRKLSSIGSQIRSGNRTEAARNNKVCESILELCRDRSCSAVQQKAWGMALLLIAEGEGEGLRNALSKRHEVEIQLFLQDAVKHMPADWIVDPLAHRSTESDPHRIPHFHDGSKLARGLIKFLFELVHGPHSIQTKTSKPSKRESIPLSLASFVSGSGKMVLGPLAFQCNVKIHTGRNSLSQMVQSIICGRLNTISTLLRLEAASTLPSQEMTGLFSELLLIHRLFLNDRCVQRQTRELLFISISRSHAEGLVHILATWSQNDLRSFLSEIILWMKPFVYSGCAVDASFPKAYRAYLASHPTTSHPILPFLYFLVELALSSEAGACLLLDLDVVKMLKLMCIRDFPNPASSVISTSMRMDRIAGSDVYASLILLFAALSSHPASCSRMMRGLNLPLWFISVHYTSDFIGLPNALNLQHAWRKLEKHVTKLVLVAMEHVLKSEYMLLKDSVDFLPMVQIYRDLIGVLRDRSSDPEMLYSAADSLLTCMEIRGEFRRTLDIVLAEGRLEDTISIFRTVHLCLAPDFPAFPQVDRSELRLGDVQRYMTCLAHSYAHELRMFSPLVAELFGSGACEARYSLGNSGRSHENINTATLPNHARNSPEDLFSARSSPLIFAQLESIPESEC